MLEALTRFSIPYSIHTVIPFVGELEPAPHPASDDVICMGSYAMRHYAKRMGWNPGVFDLEPYDFSVQLAHWGEAMLNADSAIAAYGEVRFEGERFVRPVDDAKAFTGAVFDSAEFAAWQHRVVALAEDIGTSLTAKTLVQVSSPKPIGQEIRCWVVDAKVVTASVYRVRQRVVHSALVDRRFVDFATDLAQRWSPQRAFCLDVCETEAGLRVVEINTINSSGFYAADMQKLVLALDGLRR
jgi:hypothetical protein